MKDIKKVSAPLARECLSMLEVDEHGLEETDRKILLAIADKFDGGPVGLKSIAAALSEEEATIENVYEPYLMQLGLLARTAKGRVLTPFGYKHLGKAPSKNALNF